MLFAHRLNKPGWLIKYYRKSLSGPDCKYSPCNTPMNNTELTLIQKKYTKSKNETEKTSLNQNITVLEADTLNPCTNGTCSIDTSAENRGKIKCSCHAGYSGITCGQGYKYIKCKNR